jgi:uncharacterized protein (DUF2141 family)
MRIRELAPLILLAFATTPTAAAAAPPTGPLDVRVRALRSEKGRVGCMLFDGPKGFPTDPNAAKQKRWCPIHGSRSTCRFTDLAAGTYAVACFHDENGNGKLDRGLFGIPKEGVAASNDAKGTFGPPSWKDARFSFPGRASYIRMKMRY